MRSTLAAAAAALFLCFDTTGHTQGNQFIRIDELVRDAMAAKHTPGAVVVVGRGDRTLFEKPYGFRATVPAEEPMTLDTVFDLASLTKVVAGTTAVMTLVEDGHLRLNDAVAAHPQRHDDQAGAGSQR